MSDPSITEDARPNQTGPLEASTELEPWIARFTWRIWPAMNWLVPAFVCLHGLLGYGSLEGFFLIPASVVIVPVTALLGSLPRYLLRKKGHRSTPLPMVPLLFVTWWGWVCFASAMTSPRNGTQLPSIFSALVGGGLPSLFETALMLGGAGCAILAWIAALIIAKIRAGRKPQNPRRSSVVVAWTSAFLIPAVLMASCVTGALLGASAVDASGDTFSDAQARDRAAKDGLDRQRLETTQRALSQVRALISPSGWTVAEIDPRPSNQCPLGSSLTNCYSWEASFSVEASDRLDLEALKATIQAKEWEVQAVTTDEWGAVELETRSPDGISITVRYSQGDSGAYVVNTTATSQSWWGSNLDDRLNVYNIDAKVHYAADAYPPIGP